MGDLLDKEASSTTRIVGSDELYAADVILEDGLRRLATTKKVNVESLSGVQEAATNYFFINSVADGQTLTLTIAATEGAPAYSKTFTVGVGESKIAFTERIVLELNQDFAGFQPYYRAIQIEDNAAVFILAKTIGEAGEALNIDDFNVTGTVDSSRGFNNLQRRTSTVQASLSTKDPRLAIFGIQGTVSSVDASVQGIFVIQPYANNDPAQIDLNVNGSGTPVEFTFPMDALDDFIVTEIRIFGLDSNISFGKFLGRNSAIPNALTVEIKSDNEMVTLPVIETTEDLADKFAFGGGDNFQLYKQSGSDKFLASFLTSTFPLRRSGTFGTGNDDYIKITVGAQLSQVVELQAAVVGFRQEG